MKRLTSCVIAPLAALLLALAATDAREVRITLLHTTDLHGRIRPTEIAYPKDSAGKDLGGLARCATMIAKFRAENPNCLLVDNGDTIQGTPASLMSAGLMMVRALNHLRYDAWVWGNHEFDWGADNLERCAAATEVPILAGNIRGDRPAITGRLRPYVVKDCDGVRVAVVGLNTPGIPNWSRPWLIQNLVFEQSSSVLRRVLRDVKREKADVIVLAAHQGYREYGDDHANQINDIARSFPEIDAIIGGHTHRPVPELFIRNALYSQANYWGTDLGRMDFTYDTDQRKLTSRKASLIKMDARVPQDAGLLALCKPDLDAADREMSRVIGAATEDFIVDGAPKRETPVHNLLCEAILDACERARHPADIAITRVLDEREELKKGPITVGDCWRLVPYENFIGVFEVTPAQLRELLEEEASLYARERANGVYGMRLALRVSAPAGRRVVSIADRDGKPFPPDRRLRVAAASYDLASAGTRRPKLRAIADAPEAKLVELRVQTRDALVEFITAKKEISPHLHGWWRTGARE
jgi:2',3'-cyclic-nucleotide 2'-phosphodiesterase/3'-nucleotidase